MCEKIAKFESIYIYKSKYNRYGYRFKKTKTDNQQFKKVFR